MEDYERFLNGVAARRQASATRALASTTLAGKIQIYAGMPHPETFPLTKATVEVENGQDIVLEGEALANVLQYQPTKGMSGFLETLRNLHRSIHDPPNWKSSELLVTSGNQDGLCKCMEMLLDIGDPVIMDDASYSAVFAILRPLQAEFISVGSDEGGMMPEKLHKALESWQPSREGQRPPRVLYISPAGSNPTGINLSAQRKREIYEVACKHDLIIIEDDPYFFLQFTDHLEPSLASMDTEGRVLRLDSFSKVMTPGLRIGYATGPRPLIDKLEKHMQVSIIHTSCLSQSIANELLKQWGIEGFLGRTRRVRDFYLRRRDAMNKAAEKHLEDLCEWTIPMGGMFFWFRVKGVTDAYHIVTQRALEKGVILVSGNHFTASSKGQPSPYIRASFSLVSETTMDAAFQILAEAIREELAEKK